MRVTQPNLIDPAFLNAAHAAPMLSEDAEREAVENGDHDTLIRAHLRLVIRIARQFKGYDCEIMDLIQEGSVGLKIAAGKFKLDKGCRFSTYANWWVRSQILEYVMRNFSQVRVGTTAAQKAMFFGRGKLFEGTAEEVAAQFGVSVSEVVTMRNRLQRDVSLNAPVNVWAQSSDEPDEWVNILVDTGPNPEEQVATNQEHDSKAAALHDALQTALTERERDILQRRAKDSPDSLQLLAEEYGISRERIRQIEVAALRKLREAMGAEKHEGTDGVSPNRKHYKGGGVGTQARRVDRKAA